MKRINVGLTGPQEDTDIEKSTKSCRDSKHVVEPKGVARYTISYLKGGRHKGYQVGDNENDKASWQNFSSPWPLRIDWWLLTNNDGHYDGLQEPSWAGGTDFWWEGDLGSEKMGESNNFNPNAGRAWDMYLHDIGFGLNRKSMEYR